MLPVDHVWQSFRALEMYECLAERYPEPVPSSDDEAEAREYWTRRHCWEALTPNRRRALLADATEYDVLYVGDVGYDPPWGFRSTATMFEKSDGSYTVKLIETLWVVTDSFVQPARAFRRAGNIEFFDEEGRQPDRYSCGEQLLLVPCGWMPQPYPGDPLPPTRPRNFTLL